MWTLAHAHGVLLSLVNVIYGLTLRGELFERRRQRVISRCLIGATLLLPGGFFLGGVTVYSGDPGVGIAMAPVGAVLLLTAVYLIARGTANVDTRAR
jgi:hypothetical protein